MYYIWVVTCMVHTKNFSAADRARFLAADPARVAATLAAEETLKQFFQSGALRGITVYGTLPPRTRPVPEGRPRDPITGAF